jgi:hypothetical protein
MKSRTSLWFLATGLGGLGVGLLIGLTFAPGQPPAASPHAMPGPPAYPFEIMPAGAHSHQQTEVPQGKAAPSLRLEVLPDPVKEGNYSLHLVTENFGFAPESVSRDPVLGEGHGHVYVDDFLFCRAYGPWVHIPRLKPGRHVIYVTLNWNNHNEYAVAGKTIGAQATIDVK